MARFDLNSFLRQGGFYGAISLLVGILAFQYAHAEIVPHKFTATLPPTQRVFIDNINLSAQDFFSAYMSKSVEERRYAELYLLGVLDSTEGASWCNYRTYKTTTIAEEIFLGFQKLDGQSQEKRASHAISEILSNKFPCGGRQK